MNYGIGSNGSLPDFKLKLQELTVKHHLIILVALTIVVLLGVIVYVS